MSLLRKDECPCPGAPFATQHLRTDCPHYGDAPTVTDPDKPVEVTQEDRDAAADLSDAWAGVAADSNDVRSGTLDHWHVVQAFARHRTRATASARQDGVREAAIDGDLARGLRTSQKALDEIARQEQANIAGYLALRDFPIGSTAKAFPSESEGPRKMGYDPASIAAQLREISHLSVKHDVREHIECQADGIGDAYIWRDLMGQCDRLAALSDSSTRATNEEGEAIAKPGLSEALLDARYRLDGWGDDEGVAIIDAALSTPSTDAGEA